MKTITRRQPIPTFGREPLADVPLMHKLARLQFPEHRRNRRIIAAYAGLGFAAFAIIAAVFA